MLCDITTNDAVEGMFYHSKLNVKSIISHWETPKVET